MLKVLMLFLFLLVSTDIHPNLTENAALGFSGIVDNDLINNATLLESRTCNNSSEINTSCSSSCQGCITSGSINKNPPCYKWTCDETGWPSFCQPIPDMCCIVLVE